MGGGDASAEASRRAGSARGAASSSRPPKPFWRWHPSRGRPDERDDDPRWLARRKHFFILTDAGKPVWSRYGDAGNLSGFAAAVSAMLASASEQLSSPVDSDERSGGDDVATPRRTSANERERERERVVSFALDAPSATSSTTTRARGSSRRVVCLQRNGLTYVALSRVSCESVPVLLRQLRLLRYQTLFVLTSAVERALSRSGSKFDPRRLLRDETGGADAALGALAHKSTWDPGAFLGAWAPLPFSSAKRTLAHRALHRALANTRDAKRENARAFAAVLATATHVVAVAVADAPTREKRKKGPPQKEDARASLPLHPDDVYLLTHFARHVGAFRANEETFAPVCLPRRDPSAFAHAHVSRLARDEKTKARVAEGDDGSRGRETSVTHDSGTFLVLVADEGGPDAFHAVRRCKADIEQALRAATRPGGGGSVLDAVDARVAGAPSGAGRPPQTVRRLAREVVEQPGSTEPPLAGSRDDRGLGDEVGDATRGSASASATAASPNPRPGDAARGSARLDGEVPRAAGGGGADRRVLHFLYVRPPLGQYAAPEWAPPLDGRDAQKKMLRAYRRVAASVGSAAAEAREPPRARASASAARRGGGGGGGGFGAGIASFFQGLGVGGGSGAGHAGGARAFGDAPRGAAGPAADAAADAAERARRRVHFESSAARVLLGFAGGDFELYVAMAPGTSRADAVAACNRLCTWLRQEEPRLFAAAA